VLKPKVYEMNDYDWWADFSPEEARKNYFKWEIDQVGISPEEVDSVPVELSKEEMMRLKFEKGEISPYYDDKIISFQDQLDLMVNNGGKFPCFFASTEY